MEIDPRVRLSYGWFYVSGLAQVVGKSNIRWASRPFSELQPTSPYTYNQYAAFVIRRGSQSRRVVVDFCDPDDLDEVAIDWCDLYCAVNLDAMSVKREGVLALGPGFGVGPTLRERIKFDAPLRGMWSHLADHRNGGQNSPGPRSLAYDYRLWQTLPPIGAYVARPAEDNYAFYVASLRENPNCVASANPERAHFMRAAKVAFGQGFTGGFVGGTESERKRYPDLLIDDRVKRTAWIQRTIRSTVVFNNPAVSGCLGWKLGQYLALGKAMISTAIVNALPAELEHGRHIHFINNLEEIPEAIDRVQRDSAYRRRLEQGAHDYWNRWLTPDVIARRAIDAAWSV